MEKLIYFKVFLLALLCVVPFVKEKGFKLYHPAILLSIIYFLEFGLPNLFMINNPQIQALYDLSSGDLNAGLNFIILVLMFFLLGFYSPYYNKGIKKLMSFLLVKLPPINNFTLVIRKLPLVLLVLFVVGWLARLITIKIGAYYHIESGMNIKIPSGFQLYAQYVSIANNFPVICLLLVFFEWLKNEKKLFFLAITLLLVMFEAIYSIPSGSKERFFLPIVLLLFIYSLKKKFPMVITLLFTVFVILFIFPFFNTYRSIVLSGDPLSDLNLAFNLYLRLFSHFDLNALGQIMQDVFAGRLNFSLVVAKVVKNTPDIWDFKLGYSYFLFVISLVPRIIWHNKPPISAFANDFGRDYGFLYPIDYSTSIDMTWVGEMFINFGWYGVFCGFIYGLFYQFLYSYFLRSRKLTILSVILYVFALYYMLRGGMFAIQFSGLLKIYFVTLILFSPFIKKLEKA